MIEVREERREQAEGEARSGDHRGRQRDRPGPDSIGRSLSGSLSPLKLVDPCRDPLQTYPFYSASLLLVLTPIGSVLCFWDCYQTLRAPNRDRRRRPPPEKGRSSPLQLALLPLGEQRLIGPNNSFSSHRARSTEVRNHRGEDRRRTVALASYSPSIAAVVVE